MRYVAAAAVSLALMVTMVSGCGGAGTGAKAPETVKAPDTAKTPEPVKAAKLPDGFNVPLYKGAKVTKTTPLESMKGWIVTVQWDAEPKVVIDYYEKLAKDRGISVQKLDASGNGETNVILVGENDKEKIALAIGGKEKGPTEGELKWGTK